MPGTSVLPYDKYLLTRGSRTSGQIILPAIRPGGIGKAAILRGLGHDLTKLIASGTVEDHFIVTEDYGGSTTLLGAGVQDVYLDGDQPIPDHPYGDAGELLEATVAHAITLEGREQTVSGCYITDFRGYGVNILEGATATGSNRISVPRVASNKIVHCHSGIVSTAVDCQVDGNRVASVRDYGFLDLAGNAQLSGNHFYGAQVAISFGYVYPFTVGPATSVNDTFSDAGIGLQTWNDGSAIRDGFTQHCWSKNIYMVGQTLVEGTVVRVARSTTNHPNIIGVHMHAPYCTFRGGRIHLNDYEFPAPESGHAGSTGIVLDNSYAVIDTRISATPSQEHQYGIKILSFDDIAGTPINFCKINIHIDNFKGATNIFGVDVKDYGGGNIGLGVYNEINITANTDQVGKYLRVPTHSATNIIRINGTAIPAGVAYP